MQSNLGEIIKTSKSLGILGGGQLGKFFTTAAQKMGYSVVVFDPDKQSPAGKIAEKHICKLYNDLEALDELKSSCTAVTTEFENVPAETLRYLEKDIVVRPSSKAIAIAQNRIKEKNFLKKIKTPEGLMPVGNFLVIDSIDSINNIDERFKIFPGILKIAQFGYDGKGQSFINDEKSLNEILINYEEMDLIAEKKIDFN